jgi:hypothetical protein
MSGARPVGHALPLAPPLWDALPGFVKHLARLEAGLQGTRSAATPGALVDVLEWHGLLPLAPALLAGEDFGADAAERGDCESRHRSHLVHASALTAELLELVDSFRDRAIAAVPFKGPVLGIQLYGDPSLRFCLDLDLLVSREQATAARALMEDRGYGVSPDIARLPHPWLLRWRKNVQLTRGTLRVELHWSALDPPAHRRFALSALAPGFVSVDVDGRTVRTLSRPQLALYLAAHGGRHAWNRAAWLVDFAQLVYTSPDLDWEALGRVARSWGQERSLLLAFRLAGDLLGVPTPPALSRRLGGDGPGRLLAAQASANLRNPLLLTARPWALQAFQLRLFERPVDRARYAAYVALTPSVQDWSLFPLPPRLCWVYAVLKPCRLCWLALRSLMTRASVRARPG